MSLKSYFPEQFEQLKQFMISANEIVRIVRIDPEMKQMLSKALAKMENDPEFPHALIFNSDSFKEPEQYFEGLYVLISDQYNQFANELSEQGSTFKNPIDAKSSFKAPYKFITFADTLSESLPDQMGSLVFLLDPEAIDDPDSFQRSIQFLCEKTNSQWLKFIVLELRTKPVIEEPTEPDKRISFQTFHLSPEEIEKRTKEDLADPASLQPVERRQCMGMLAGFAFARKDYAEAEQLQRQWESDTRTDGEPNERAAVLYNLGNTLLAKGEYSEATDLYCEACNLCVDNQINSLAPLVYTNLGISLHRQGNFEQAFATLKVASDMFKAQNHKPGEAYVVECLAQMYADNGQNDEAEQAWRYALSIYNGVTSTLFIDLREKGCANIHDKLKLFFEQTKQFEKIEKLEETSGASHAD